MTGNSAARLLVFGLCIAGLWIGFGAGTAFADQKEEARDKGKESKRKDAGSVTLVVTLPASARLTIDGKPTTSKGPRREFVTPDLSRDQLYAFTLEAEDRSEGERIRVRKHIVVRAGTRMAVSFPIRCGKLAGPEEGIPEDRAEQAGREEARQGRLGVLVGKPTPAQADQRNLSRGKGLLVHAVAPDSAAHKARIKVDDVLLEVGGKDVPDDPDRFVRQLADLKPNTAHEVVVLRNGKRETLKGLSLPDRKPRDKSE